MMTKFICIGWLILIVFTAQGQDSLKASKLSLSIGAFSTLNKDEFQYPFTYQGNNFMVNAMYNRFKTKSQHAIDLTYSGGTLNATDLPQANSTIFLLNYDYFYNVNHKDTNSKLKVAFGGGLHTLFNSIDYLPSVDNPQHYFTLGAFVTVGGKIEYQISNRSSLSLQGSLPLFGVVYRPDFEINGKTLTALSPPGCGLSTAKLEYAYTLISRFSFTVAYNYSYFNFPERRPISILQQGLSVGLKFRL